jgi:hypothetical protein
MSQIEFEWDENKNQKNIAKHKVSFEEAKSAFYDPNALVIHDPRNSDDNEDRFLLLGMSGNLIDPEYGNRYNRISWDPEKIEDLLIDLFVEHFHETPKEIILDFDATDIPLHGDQESSPHFSQT